MHISVIGKREINWENSSTRKADEEFGKFSCLMVNVGGPSSIGMVATSVHGPWNFKKAGLASFESNPVAILWLLHKFLLSGTFYVWAPSLTSFSVKLWYTTGRWKEILPFPTSFLSQCFTTKIETLSRKKFVPEVGYCYESIDCVLGRSWKDIWTVG